MTHDKVHFGLAKLVVIAMFVQLLVIAFVGYHDWQARDLVVTAARSACELSKADRKASVILNKAILVNFKDTDRLRGTTVAPKRVEAENQIHEQTTKLNVRAKISCAKAFPKASLIP